MASKKFIVDIDLTQQQLLNAALQVLGAFPASPVLGQIIYHSTKKSSFIWTGDITNVGVPDNPGWLDLGQLYTHPTYAGTAQPAAATTGANIISQITLNNGHVTGVQTRALTPANIGAATAVHTHAFGEITGLGTMTVLGNNTATTGPAKALTVSDLLLLLGISYGTAAQLTAGTDTTQKTWSAKDLTDWVNGKIATYLSVVNLALGTGTATTLPITNSAGTGVTLPSVTTTLAGLMSAADKIKLDGIAAGANAYVHPTDNPGAHPFATALTQGLQVLSQMTVTDEGHVISIAGRNLTADDIASVMIVAGTNITSENQTWSAKVINDKLAAAVAQAQTGALTYKGDFNPVTNTPAITTAGLGVKMGWTYVVSTTGTFAGQAVEAGDMIIARIDNPLAVAGNWQIVNKNIPAIVAASETVQGIIELATAAEAIAGTDHTRAITPLTLKAVLDQYTGGYYSTFGNGSGTSFTITHGLGTDRVLVQTRVVATKEEIILDWRAASSTTVTLNMNKAPATGEYEVLITKI